MRGGTGRLQIVHSGHMQNCAYIQKRTRCHVLFSLAQHEHTFNAQQHVSLYCPPGCAQVSKQLPDITVQQTLHAKYNVSGHASHGAPAIADPTHTSTFAGTVPRREQEHSPQLCTCKHHKPTNKNSRQICSSSGKRHITFDLASGRTHPNASHVYQLIKHLPRPKVSHRKVAKRPSSHALTRHVPQDVLHALHPEGLAQNSIHTYPAGPKTPQSMLHACLGQGK